MRLATPAILIATAASLALGACGVSDDEPPANTGNQIDMDTDASVMAEDAVPAPEGMEDDVDLPINDSDAVSPNTVDGVGTDDADAGRRSY